MAVTVLRQPIATKIDVLVLDASLKEDHDAEIEVTDHAVEQGIKISDHARPRPREVTIEGIVSDTPITSAQSSQAASAVGSASAGNSPGWAESARQSILDLWKTPRIVTLTTGLETYPDMIMTSHKETRDAKTGYVYHFTAKFKQVRVVSTSKTVVATKQVKGKPKVNKGTTTTTPATTPVISRSLTADLTAAGILVSGGN